MDYTIIANNKTYTLPSKTIALMEELENASKVDEIQGMSLRSKFETLHNFIKCIFGDENAAEILGSSEFDKIDLSDITLTINKIIDAYEKPIQDYQDEKMRKAFNGMPMDKIISMTKAAQSVANMQMMKK